MSKNIKEQYNLEKGTYLDYNNIEKQIPNNIIPYIIADGNKAKYLKYCVNEKFYELNSNTMAKAISIGSKYVLETINNAEKNGLFNDETNIYYFDILDNNGNFGITNVIKISNDIKEVSDETNIIESSEFDSTSSSKYEQDDINGNSSPIKNRRESSKNANLFGIEQKQSGINEKRQTYKNSITNNGRELGNSSFS